MDPVVHFEMPYDDGHRMARFYPSVFKWDTTKSDRAGPKRSGAIIGGFYKRNPDWLAKHPSTVIVAENMREAMLRVTDTGGQMLGEPM
jgi:hypothetical protein